MYDSDVSAYVREDERQDWQVDMARMEAERMREIEAYGYGPADDRREQRYSY